MAVLGTNMFANTPLGTDILKCCIGLLRTGAPVPRFNFINLAHIDHITNAFDDVLLQRVHIDRCRKPEEYDVHIVL